MKSLKTIIGGILLLFIPVMLLTSCDDDEEVTIKSIQSYTAEPSTPITTAYTDEYICLVGEGFDGLKAIYCNGFFTDFNPALNSATRIIFKIAQGTPTGADVENEEWLNTIRIVTKHGEDTYKGFAIRDKNKMPGISRVSHTLPRPGQLISIHGAYLSETTHIYFPGAGGEVEATDFTTSGESEIIVRVPDGVGEVSGAIRVICQDEELFSPSYMFYKKGIFLSTFTEEVYTSVAGSGVSNVTIVNGSSAIAAITGVEHNPENAIMFPSTGQPGTVNVATGNDDKYGYFRYDNDKTLEAILAQTGGEITAGTSINNLAIQFDLYITSASDWNSGVVALRMSKNANKTQGPYVYNYVGWTNNSAYKIKDWQTVSVPFSSFSNITGAGVNSIAEYYAKIGGSNHGIFTFVNYNIDGIYSNRAPRQLEDFKLLVANFRIVPL